MIYREASVSDAPNVANIVADVAGEAYKNAGNTDQLEQWLSEEADAEVWHKRISSVKYFVFIAENSDIQGIGYIRNDAMTAYFGGFYTRKPGQGIGSKIFYELLNQARKRGCQQGHCEIWEKLSASRRFFENRGFKVKQEHPGRTFGGARFLDYYRVL